MKLCTIILIAAIAVLSLWAIWPASDTDVSSASDTEVNSPSDNDVRSRKRRTVSALISGIIGQTVATMRTAGVRDVGPTQGGCAWYGTAPFCRPDCPENHDQVRTDDGLCTVQETWQTGQHICIKETDTDFGLTCGIGSKGYCCRSDSPDCSWAGRWKDGNSGKNFYCHFISERTNLGRKGRIEDACGAFKCRNSVDDAYLISNITNAFDGQCNAVQFAGFVGDASCGLIIFHDDSGKTVARWYKST